MRNWIEHLLNDSTRVGTQLRIVLDPDSLLGERDLKDMGHDVELEMAHDWLDLRRIYERSGRGRLPENRPLVIVVSSEELRESRRLPWDIERTSKVTKIRLPAPEAVRGLILALPEEMQDHALEASSGPDPLGALLLSVWGIGLPRSGASGADEMDAVIRLRTDPTVPESIWPSIKKRLRTQLAIGLASEPIDTPALQAAWADWIDRAEASEWHTLFERLGPRITSLFYAGFLVPVAADRPLPAWAAPGARQPGHREMAEALLEAEPVEGIPQSMGAWLELAEWWGDVRLALALGAPETDDLIEPAWARWERWDEGFRDFLHSGFGRLLSSSSERPQGVHRIAPFLARRLRDGQAERVMLVVFDGMGFPHWSLMRSMTGVRILDASGVLAMAPTLTPISRQAVFAGNLPNTFPDCFANTKKEGDLWTEFWTGEGLSVTDVGYKNIEGTGPSEVPSFPDERAVGIVVRAIDELMHTSELLGEAQFATNVETWLRFGFVRELVERAADDGFEIWFTADHGSLPVVPLGRPMEGLAVDTAGTRVRLYSTKALRDQSKADGDAWDPPGMPADGPFALFPWGRFGLRHDVRVTHGGLSFDEMIVPFVRVAP